MNILLGTTEQIFEQWENFKSDLKHFFQKLGKQKAKERNLERKSLEARIRNCTNLLGLYRGNIALKNYLKKLKTEMELLNSFYIASCRHNTYYSDFVSDKVSLATAKSLQRRDREQRHIQSMMKADGTIVYEQAQVMAEVKQQYVELFTSDGIDNDSLQYFLQQNGLPKLQDEQKSKLEEAITPAEVKKAIHCLQGKKTPGYDGIPVEFYWLFSDQLCVFLSRLFNLFTSVGYMNNSCYDGVISLLFKGAGESHVRENWRPLALLNLDYKIYSKVLALRLEAVMKSLVHPDQTSSVPGRNIQDSLAHVMCVNNYASEHHIDAMILSLDQKAAFDMIEWQYIFKTLSAMNFGPFFIERLKCIYVPGRTRSLVNVNGFLSEPFNVFRGIRQGCPLSPLLYNITSEVVAHYIRITPLLRGIPLCGTNSRITKYADDTSLFLIKWSEITEVFGIFRKFQAASGSRLKFEKTQLLLLGSLKNAIVPQRYAPFVVEK